MSEMNDLNRTLKFQLGMFEKITQRLDLTNGQQGEDEKGNVLNE